MHTHLMNDNEDKAGRRIGSAFWRGRWVLSPDDSDYTKLGVEWGFGRKADQMHLTLKFDFVNDRDITFSVAIWRLFYVYLSFASHRFPWWSYAHGNRKLGISCFGDCLWLDLWNDPDNSHLHRQVILHVVDWLLGKNQHSQNEVATGNRTLDLPERTYWLKIVIVERVWKRPRWFANRQLTATIMPDVDIPIPGHPDSDFYSGEDAWSEVSLPANSIDDAVGKFFKHVYDERVHYGGVNWRPEVVNDGR